MTPKEKAKELVLRMLHESINKNIEGERMEGQTVAAKQCALIAVDEIINQLSEIEDNYDDEFLGGYKKFLSEVKEEIKKL